MLVIRKPAGMVVRPDRSRLIIAAAERTAPPPLPFIDATANLQESPISELRKDESVLEEGSSSRTRGWNKPNTVRL